MSDMVWTIEQVREPIAQAKKDGFRDGLAAAAELEKLLEKMGDPQNWGYFDASGCPKGRGRYQDSWIGDGHPMDFAAALRSADEAQLARDNAEETN